LWYSVCFRSPLQLAAAIGLAVEAPGADPADEEAE
jgi:hypothetical protein